MPLRLAPQRPSRTSIRGYINLSIYVFRRPSSSYCLVLVYTLPGATKLTATKCLPKDARLVKDHLGMDILENTDDVEEGVLAAVVILILELILVAVLLALQCKQRSTGRFTPVPTTTIVPQSPPRPHLDHDIDWDNIRI